MSHIINAQPEDNSYAEILRELAFARMVDRGLRDFDAGRPVGNKAMHARIRPWQSRTGQPKRGGGSTTKKQGCFDPPAHMIDSAHAVSFTRTLRLKVKPEACAWLNKAAIEVNQVWNWANATSLKAARPFYGKPKWLSGFDLCKLSAGGAGGV